MPEGGGRARGGRLKIHAAGTVLFSVLLGLLATAGCRITPVRLVPPSAINYLDGQASFYMRGPEGAARFRLSFYFQPPGSARLEIYDPLGRLQTIIWLNEEAAALFLPAQKLFWQGDGRIITSELFGRELQVRELIRILSGQWRDLAAEDGWHLERPAPGSALSGWRDDLKFEIKESFPPGLVPKTVNFSARDYSTRMRVQRLHFNRYQKDSLFVPQMPPGARKVEWEEIVNLWKK